MDPVRLWEKIGKRSGVYKVYPSLCRKGGLYKKAYLRTEKYITVLYNIVASSD